MFKLRDLCFVMVFATAAVLVQAQEAPVIKGMVFNDLNKNGTRDAGEPGIAGVPVSNQKEIVKTGADGTYQLPGAEHITVFVNTPAQWEAPADKTTGVPQFFKNFHAKDSGMFKATEPAPTSVDFALTKRADADSKEFSAVIMGDSQLPERQFAAYQAYIVSELMGMRNKPGFVMTLGDICSENLGGFPTIASMTAQAGSTVYGVIGNHDRNYKAKTFEESSASYKLTYGPDYYSFDRGDVHFLVLNSIFFTGPGSSYGNGFNAEQLEWMKQDLADTPKDKLLVLCMHAPLCNRNGKVNFKGQETFFSLLQDREAPIVAVAGHWHTTNAFQLKPENGWNGKQPFTMAIVPHACGSWWAGPQNEQGLPLSYHTDGTPNGFTIWNFQGTKYQVTFQPSGSSTAFQSQIYTPDQRAIAFGPGLGNETILVNAFFTFYDAQVQCRIDNGEWKTMEKVADMKDPYVASKLEGPYAGTAGWIKVPKSGHLWKIQTGKLTPGTHTVRVKFPNIDGTTIEQGKMFISY